MSGSKLAYYVHGFSIHFQPEEFLFATKLSTDLSLKTHAIIELLTRWPCLRALNLINARHLKPNTSHITFMEKKVLTIIAALNFCFTTRPYTSNAVRQIKARPTSVVVKNISHLLLVETFVGVVGS